MSGMRVGPSSELVTLCSRLSSLTQLTALRLADNVVDLSPQSDTPDCGRVAAAVCALLSALTALRHLDLSDVCLAGRLSDVLASVGSARLASLEISRRWLDQHDLTALQRFQRQRTHVVVRLRA